ncbi:MAG TPA: zinc-dependent alcohol dehydrogenase [Bryobacteraceae bacterium]|nr:zinc-dependent alcohol dehydrogenase [Bryobacteraceae bacterium]
MPTKGRGAFVRSFKQPLHLEGIAFSDPSPGEILAQMKASGVCHTDLHAVDGDWPIKPLLPFIPGHEGVGVAVKVGRDVRNVKEGDRVGLPWLRAACGQCEWCLTGWETLCPKAVYGGYTANGSFADYVLAPAAYVAHIPNSLSDIDAAPILCAGVTMWKALKETEAQPGQWVAISGVGGLGQLGVQYAVAMGLQVIAIDIDPEKLPVAKRMGAEITLNAKQDDVVKTVQSEIGGAHGVVVTAVSLSAFTQAIDITRRKGTCVLVGLPPGEFPTPIFDVVLKRITIRGSLVGTRADLQDCLSIAAHRNIRSHAQTEPLEKVNRTLDDLRQGKIKGRVVLTM